MVRYIIPILIIVLGLYRSNAQHLGGTGDGGSSFLVESPNEIHHGGNDDGNSAGNYVNVNSIQRGGTEDGFSMDQNLNSSSIQRGSTQDGYALYDFHNNNSIHWGSAMDGYALGQEFQRYIWTGLVSQEWTTKDNWSTFVVPRPRHTVIIPSDTPFHPVLQTPGTLVIGKDTGQGTYLGRELYISSDAKFEIGKNVFINNYGLINNRGIFNIYNLSSNAFINEKNATLHIQGGSIEFINNE